MVAPRTPHESSGRIRQSGHLTLPFVNFRHFFSPLVAESQANVGPRKTTFNPGNFFGVSGIIAIESSKHAERRTIDAELPERVHDRFRGVVFTPPECNLPVLSSAAGLCRAG